MGREDRHQSSGWSERAARTRVRQSPSAPALSDEARSNGASGRAKSRTGDANARAPRIFSGWYTSAASCRGAALLRDPQRECAPGGRMPHYRSAGGASLEETHEALAVRGPALRNDSRRRSCTEQRTLRSGARRAYLADVGAAFDRTVRERIPLGWGLGVSQLRGPLATFTFREDARSGAAKQRSGCAHGLPRRRFFSRLCPWREAGSSLVHGSLRLAAH